MGTKVNKTQERIDKLMERIPEPPKGFGDWVIKNSMPESKYIFYKKKGRKAYGVCSSCGAHVVVENASHKAKGKCPECKQKITFKAINKAKYYKDSEIVSVMQRMKGNKYNQYVIRYFKVMKVFKHDEDTSNFPDEVLNTLVDPEFFIYEGSREILTVRNDGTTKWEAVEELWDYKTSQNEWKKERKRGMYFNKELLRDSIPFIYKRNLKRLLKNTKWKYSGLGHFSGIHMNIGNYLTIYERYPTIEMLSKAGANRMLRDIVESYSCWGGIGGVIKMNQKFLGLSKSIFNRAIKLNISAHKVEFLVVLEELNYNITDAQVVWAIDYTHTETFTQLLKYTSANKVILYLESQARGSSDKYMTPERMATTWRDYLHQCEILGIDLKKSYFLFPKDLEERHVEYTKVYEAKRDIYINEGIIKTFNAWKDLDYEEGEYKIVVARNQNMIIAEGSYMGHCVGGTTYTKGMARGKKIILMCRKNSKPYSTIELNPKTFKIVQNHGKNYHLETDAVEFANRWLKKHVEKIKMRRLSENKEKTVKPVIGSATGGTYGNSQRIAI